MYLAILEVSQKQAYIFSQKQLMENVRRSELIAHVTSSKYIGEVCKWYDERKNLVYSGGGHIILKFDTAEQAREAVREASYTAYTKYDGMELFGKILKADERLSLGENIKLLTKGLERKKSLRLSGFKRFGTGLEPVSDDVEIEYSKIKVEDGYQKMHPRKIDKLIGKDNFFAAVHIDGNGMGAKSQEVTEKAGNSWDDCCKMHQAFSKDVDEAFKTALMKTIQLVEKWQLEGKLEEPLGFSDDDDFHPIRPIISAGDDICFITPAKIALQCASAFLRFLAEGEIRGEKEENNIKPFAACAGVAMVHTKYPFHRAYGMSEALCSSAKKYSAFLADSAEGKGGEFSTIDWHIEYGQGKSGIGDIRRDYLMMNSGSGKTEDNPIRTLNLRPLLVVGDSTVCSPYRTYEFFGNLIKLLKSDKVQFPSSKIKGLRGEMKKSEAHTIKCMIDNQMQELPKAAFDAKTEGSFDSIAAHGGRESSYYVTELENGKFYRRSLYFDAIEIMDETSVIE